MKEKSTLMSNNNEYSLAYISGDDVSARIPIVKKLSNLGYSVEIVGSEDKEIFQKNNVAYSRYFLNREFSIQDDRQSHKEIVNLLDNRKYDIVHSFDTKPNIIVPSAANKIDTKRPKVVRTVTGIGRIFTSNSLKNIILRVVYRFIQKRLKPYIDMTIFQNQDDYDYFLKHKLITTNKAKIIKGSGIDLTTFNQQKVNTEVLENLRKELNLKVGTKTFILVGRLVKQKGIIEFLEAARICKNKNKDFNILLVGPIDSKEDAVPEKFIHQFKDCITYLGRRTDVKELLAISDVFVLPTFYREGVPRVLLEAAAMGLGIITTDMPGCNDVVQHDWNGYLIPIKNAEVLADTMMKIATEDAKLKTFGERNLKHVLKFSLDKVLKEYHEVYKALV